jgi:hypothetical protein
MKLLLFILKALKKPVYPYVLVYSDLSNNEESGIIYLR